jgi:hypothetical protein
MYLKVMFKLEYFAVNLVNFKYNIYGLVNF